MNTSRTLAPPKDASTHLSPPTSAPGNSDAAEPAHETNSNGYAHLNGDFHPSETEGDSTLSSIEREELRRLEAYVSRVTVSFRLAASALLRIQRRKEFYRGSHRTFEAYCRDRLGFTRRHAYRLIEAASIIERVSGDPLTSGGMCPIGHIPNSPDPLTLFVTEWHFRPLNGLSPGEQDDIIGQVDDWAAMAGADAITAKVVGSAASLLGPPRGPVDAPSNPYLQKVRDILAAKRARAAGYEGILLEEAADEVIALAHQECPTRDWCLIESRPARPSYGGGLRMLFDDLGAPLQQRLPSLFHVDADPDLFGEAVPDEFLRLVFNVMEKAHWHRFLITTRNLNRARPFWEQAGSPQNVKLGADEGRIP